MIAWSIAATINMAWLVEVVVFNFWFMWEDSFYPLLPAGKAYADCKVQMAS